MRSPEHAATPGGLHALPPAIPDHELLRLIGRGAYGEVWMARNAIGTLRAVKIVHRQSFLKAEHFEREFKGLLKFEPISRSHNGLVDILQIGRRDDAGYFYYVMELADDANVESTPTRPSDTLFRRMGESGGEGVRSLNDYAPHTLRSDLRHHANLPPAECVSLGLKLASALEHLHANGLVHRDIKPSNIIFVDGEPKLADIGLVTAIDEAQSLVGTAGYIPPEGPGKPQADLYSLGKVLYEIAFGKERQEFPQLPPDLPSHPDYTPLLELNEIILRACESDPRRRYHSAHEMRTDLVRLQHGKSVKQARTRKRYWAVAKKLAVAASVVALLVAALTLFKGLKRGHTPDPEAARLYEEGRWYYGQLTPEAHEKALAALTQAVQKDPKFIQPYGEMTMVYVWPMLPGITNDQIRLQKIQEVADKAFAINPNSAEGHMALSWCRFLQRNWGGAEDEIRHALRINPNLALAHDSYCAFLSMQMKAKEARREAEWVAKQPPVSRRASAIIAAFSLIAERRIDDAVATLRQVLDLDPNFVWGYSDLGDYYDAQSNYLAAVEAYRKVATLSGLPADKITAWYDAVRRAYEAEGAQGYFRKWIELIRANEALPENERISDLCYPNLACCYAQIGDKDMAFAELNKHFDEPYGWNQIKYDPRYDSLHDDPRYKALVKRAGLEP
jgi:tetratricopeptide (TPR) repeat protein